MNNDLMIEVSNDWLQGEMERFRLREEELQSTIKALEFKCQRLEHELEHQFKYEVLNYNLDKTEENDIEIKFK